MKYRLRRTIDLIIEKQTAISGDNIITLENVQSWTGKIIGHTGHESVKGEMIRFKKGDVLFNKLRPYLAKVVSATEDGLCTGEMLVMRPKEGVVDSEYLFYYMLSKRTIDDINVATYGVKMPRANWDFVGSLEIDLPPIEQQRKIAKDIKDRLTKIDEASTQLKKSINQIEEYRSSLISNVVGGKVTI